MLTILRKLGAPELCKAPLNPVAEPVEADPELFDEIIQQARVPEASKWLGR